MQKHILLLLKLCFIHFYHCLVYFLSFIFSRHSFICLLILLLNSFSQRFPFYLFLLNWWTFCSLSNFLWNFMFYFFLTIVSHWLKISKLIISHLFSQWTSSSSQKWFLLEFFTWSLIFTSDIFVPVIIYRKIMLTLINFSKRLSIINLFIKTLIQIEIFDQLDSFLSSSPYWLTFIRLAFI